MFTSKTIVKFLALGGLFLFADDSARANSTVKSKTSFPQTLSYEKCTPQNNYYHRSLLQDPIHSALQSLRDATLVAERTDRSCSTCGMVNRNPFQVIESQFSFLDQKKHPLRQPSEQDLKCVQAAQMTYNSGGGGYATCSGPKSGLKRESVAPCVSETYVDLTTRAFNLVSSCTQLSRREAYGLFLQESGLHMNALSHTGAGGIGQLTQVAILGVQQVDASEIVTPEVKNVSTRVKNEIQSNPGCAPLREFEKLTLKESEAARRCEVLSFPRSPLYPMVLSMKHYQYGKAHLRAIISTLDLKKRFGEAKNAELETELAQYAYNTGVSGIASSFLVYARTATAKRAKSVDAFMKGFQAHLAANFSESEDRRKEVSNHVRSDTEARGVQNRLKAMDKKGGVACFAD